jgi:hypothetical protein
MYMSGHNYYMAKKDHIKTGVAILKIIPYPELHRLGAWKLLIA